MRESNPVHLVLYKPPLSLCHATAKQISEALKLYGLPLFNYIANDSANVSEKDTTVKNFSCQEKNVYVWPRFGASQRNWMKVTDDKLINWFTVKNLGSHGMIFYAFVSCFGLVWLERLKTLSILRKIRILFCITSLPLPITFSIKIIMPIVHFLWAEAESTNQGSICKFF